MQMAVATDVVVLPGGRHKRACARTPPRSLVVTTAVWRGRGTITTATTTTTSATAMAVAVVPLLLEQMLEKALTQIVGVGVAFVAAGRIGLSHGGRHGPGMMPTVLRRRQHQRQD